MTSAVLTMARAWISSEQWWQSVLAARMTCFQRTVDGIAKDAA